MRIKQTIAVLALSTVALTACSQTTTESGSGTSASNSGAASGTAASEASNLTVENCGEEVTFSSADNLFVNDGNIISIALAAGARDNIKWVSSVQRDLDILKAKYGTEVDGLESVADKYPSLEEIVSKQPDIYVAGWNYGLNEGENITPESLSDQGIGSYILTESCRQEGTTKRGIVDPWTAVETDVANIGQITGHSDTADAVVADQKDRLAALKAAPQADTTPVAFVFDSATDTIFTSGSFGAPEAIITAAGAKNAASDIEDTWTTVGWEHLTANTPDVFVFVSLGYRRLLPPKLG